VRSDGGGRRRCRLLGGRRDRRGERRQAGEPEPWRGGFILQWVCLFSPSNIGLDPSAPYWTSSKTRSRLQIQPVFPGLRDDKMRQKAGRGRCRAKTFRSAMTDCDQAPRSVRVRRPAAKAR